MSADWAAATLPREVLDWIGEIETVKARHPKPVAPANDKG